MKIGLITKVPKEGKKPKYHSAGVLIETLGLVEDHQEQMFIGVRGGVIQNIKRMRVGNEIHFFKLVVSVTYQVWAYNFLKSQIGKKAMKPKWWDSVLKTPEEIQESRKSNEIWTSAELVAAVMAKIGQPLFLKRMPYQMDAEMISTSPRLHLEGKVRIEKNARNT